MMNLVVKAVEYLPKPDSLNLSPVTFREFGQAVSDVARAMHLSKKDQASITSKLKLRGLLDGKQLDANWASAGLGFQKNFGGPAWTPGIRIDDNAAALQIALQGRGLDTSIVQGANGNQALDPGETAVIWFDIENDEQLTAGGVTLTVTSLDPEISFVQAPNPGWISSTKVQTQYSKINGTGIVSSISQSAGPGGVHTSNSYFESVPEYMYSPPEMIDLSTGIWLQVAPGAAHGKVVRFQVEAKPSNGQASTVQFNATIQ